MEDVACWPVATLTALQNDVGCGEKNGNLELMMGRTGSPNTGFCGF